MPFEPPPEIVITAQPLRPARSEAPLAVTVITREDLRGAGAGGLEQALQQVAGLQLFRRSDARSANPTSQGVTLRALGGNASSRALLLLDGVPQTDPFGGWVNWPAYDPLSLAQVRVTRGGGSVANGPGALAGTIALESDAEPGVLVDGAAGSRGSAQGRLIAAQRLGSGLAGVALHAARGDGFRTVVADDRGPIDGAAPYRNASGRLRWTGPLSAGIAMQVAASAFTDKRSRGLPFSDNRSRGADASLRLNGRGAWQWTALGYAQRRKFESGFAATDASRTTARLTSLQYDVPGRSLGWSVEVRPPVGQGRELRLGADGRRMRGRSNELGTYVGGTATRDRSAGGRTGHAGVFAEASWDRGPLLLTGGVRLDRFDVTGGRFVERNLATGLLTRDIIYADRSEWLRSARAGGELALGSRLSLRTAGYTGWRPPTLNELFRPFRLGNDATAANAELAPERLAGVEAGLDHRTASSRLQLTVFRNRLSDAIANVTLGSGPGQFAQVGFVPAGGQFRQRQNLRAIDVTGVEAGASWKRGPWRLGGEVSWTRARISDDGLGGALSGLRPAQTPALAASASLAWSGDPIEAALQFRAIGAQYEDDLNRERLPPAATLDGSLRLRLGPRLQLIARAENVLDATVIAGRAGNGVEERATPRTLWLGIRFRGDPA